MSDYECVSTNGRDDERKEGVVLVDSGEDWKETAEDMGSFWIVVSWELMDAGNLGTVWFERSSYSIEKKVIDLLSNPIPQ